MIYGKDKFELQSKAQGRLYSSNSVVRPEILRPERQTSEFW